jgi:hypothetical protein
MLLNSALPCFILTWIKKCNFFSLCRFLLKLKRYHSRTSQSTYIYGVPQCMTVCPLVWTGTLPPPLSQASVPLPPVPKVGGSHSPAGEGLGESQYRRLEKSLALCQCLLCVARLWINILPEFENNILYSYIQKVCIPDSLLTNIVKISKICHGIIFIAFLTVHLIKFEKGQKLVYLKRYKPFKSSSSADS